MAKADKENEAEASAEEGKPQGKARGGMGLLLPILLAVLLSAGVSAGISFFMTQHLVDAELHKDDPVKKEEAAKEEPKAPAVYVALDPAFVVNLEDASGSRFMQVSVQLMTRDPKGQEVIKASEPRIRNDILMLFSQQNITELATLQGKEKLRTAVLDAVQKILSEETGKPEVEGVFFTSFVIQ